MHQLTVVGWDGPDPPLLPLPLPPLPLLLPPPPLLLPLGGGLLLGGGVPDVDGGVDGVFGFVGGVDCVGQFALASITDPSLENYLKEKVADVENNSNNINQLRMEDLSLKGVAAAVAARENKQGFGEWENIHDGKHSARIRKSI